MSEARSRVGDPDSLKFSCEFWSSLGNDLGTCVFDLLPGVGDTVLKLMPFDLAQPERVTLLWVISKGLEGGVSNFVWWSIGKKLWWSEAK